MNNEGQTNSQDTQIQGLLDQYLQSNSLNLGFKDNKEHLNEDSLSAFVEGNLLERESKPIISHLANCAYCRHISAELVKLDFAVVDEPAVDLKLVGEPTRVSEVLNGVLSRIFGTTDGSVFAHNENEEKDEEKETPE